MGARASNPGPRLSIVTVVRNAVHTIGDTLESVCLQDYPNRELIVIDGASTDGTLQVVATYADCVDYCVSEPDDGISDAMNKGFALTHGDYVLFLHADDYLNRHDALSRAVKTISSAPEVDVHAFGLSYLRDQRLVAMRPRGFTPWMNLKTGVLHQAAICRRTLFERLGGFDASLRIAMDYDFFLRAYRAGASLQTHPEEIAVMRDIGVSSRRDSASLIERFREERAVHAKNCNNGLLKAFYRWYWPAYVGYRGLREFGDPRVLRAALHLDERNGQETT